VETADRPDIDKIRGHKFWPDRKALDAIPALYATDGLDLDEKTCHLHFFTGGSAWWVFELDPATGEAFAWCDLGLGFPELGYVNLNELAGLLFVAEGRRFPTYVERDLHFAPTRFGDLNDRTGR